MHLQRRRSRRQSRSRRPRSRFPRQRSRTYHRDHSRQPLQPCQPTLFLPRRCWKKTSGCSHSPSETTWSTSGLRKDLSSVASVAAVRSCARGSPTGLHSTRISACESVQTITPFPRKCKHGASRCIEKWGAGAINEPRPLGADRCAQKDPPFNQTCYSVGDGYAEAEGSHGLEVGWHAPVADFRAAADRVLERPAGPNQVE